MINLEPTTSDKVWIAIIILLMGFMLSSVSNLIGRHWGRNDIFEEAIDRGYATKETLSNGLDYYRWKDK